MINMLKSDCFVSFVAVTCLKFLFIPLYKSTDFEVHRNWMAITYQKPIKEWYFEQTSEWTLDYPPLFAWFEYFLALVAQFFDSGMLKVSNLNYSSPPTVFFLRLSVIVSDIVYFYGVYRIFQLLKEPRSKDPWTSRDVILSMLLLWNPGLLIVDHIHFQYNGLLSGILLISIADMMEAKYVASAFWFSVLINMKHIYLYLAPAYFLYLLKHYCFKIERNGSQNKYKFQPANFLKLAGVGIAVVLVSFGPFIYMGQMNQVISRLFPVKRGLTHSYWAPNFWALYNFVDRILVTVATRLKIYSLRELHTCSTRGLVKECEFSFLPNIPTIVTLILAVTAMIPVFWIIWKNTAHSKYFLRSIVLCSFGSFMFGYHVHEKAILLITLPLTVLAVLHKEEAKIYTILSIIAHFSLFPLLYEEGETMLKISLLLLHGVYSVCSLSHLHQTQTLPFSLPENHYLFGLIVLQAFYSFGARFAGIERKLPFLPLMLISTYCALGVLYSWIQICRVSLSMEPSRIKEKKR